MTFLTTRQKGRRSIPFRQRCVGNKRTRREPKCRRRQRRAGDHAAEVGTPSRRPDKLPQAKTDHPGDRFAVPGKASARRPRLETPLNAPIR